MPPLMPDISRWYLLIGFIYYATPFLCARCCFAGFTPLERRRWCYAADIFALFLDAAYFVAWLRLAFWLRRFLRADAALSLLYVVIHLLRHCLLMATRRHAAATLSRLLMFSIVYLPLYFRFAVCCRAIGHYTDRYCFTHYAIDCRWLLLPPLLAALSLRCRRGDAAPPIIFRWCFARFYFERATCRCHYATMSAIDWFASFFFFFRWGLRWVMFSIDYAAATPPLFSLMLFWLFYYAHYLRWH